MASNQSLPDGIVILDFGGQYCHLIARRVREMNVYSEILPNDVALEDIAGLSDITNVKGIILSGSPASVRGKGSLQLNPAILKLQIPVLGLCYGHQLLASMYGGEVGRGKVREYGITEIFVDEAIGVLQSLDPKEQVWMSHGDTVFKAPSGFKVLAHTEACPVAAMYHDKKQLWGLQWHPEVVHTEHGTEMLHNFIFNICGCQANWKPLDTVDEAIKEIQSIVGASKAVIALSGGVDSSVAAALAGRALGDRLVAVHVDHGFMRMNESRNVAKAFEEQDLELIVIDAKDRFMKALKGVTDPEEKRKIIGEEFIRVFEDEARKVGAKFLIQGTIYPDRIESGISKNADIIKTHHNVGGLPLDMDFKQVVEPLKDLYKDEVRGLGERLKLPRELVWRQPFPGPGLAVRIMGEVTDEKLEVLRYADAVVCEEVEAHAIKNDLWQYFAVLTDTKSTGVKGDERVYGWTLAIRMVESIDAMTANFTKAPWDLLEKISNRIANEIEGATRTVYDITHKPPSTIEWE